MVVGENVGLEVITALRSKNITGVSWENLFQMMIKGMNSVVSNCVSQSLSASINSKERIDSISSCSPDQEEGLVTQKETLEKMEADRILTPNSVRKVPDSKANPKISTVASVSKQSKC